MEVRRTHGRHDVASQAAHDVLCDDHLENPSSAPTIQQRFCQFLQVITELYPIRWQPQHIQKRRRRTLSTYIEVGYLCFTIRSYRRVLCKKSRCRSPFQTIVDTDKERNRLPIPGVSILRTILSELLGEEIAHVRSNSCFHLQGLPKQRMEVRGH